MALAIMGIKGDLGMDIDLRRVPNSKINRLDELLFSESYARFLIATPSKSSKDIEEIARKYEVPVSNLGSAVDSHELLLKYGKKQIRCGLEDLKKRWNKSMRRYLGEL